MTIHANDITVSFSVPAGHPSLKSILRAILADIEDVDDDEMEGTVEALDDIEVDDLGDLQ